MATITPSGRTTVKRMPERGAYDTELIHSILDEALHCHVGFVVDGSPVVIPTIHARIGETLYLHGSPASRMLRHLKGEADLCVTVTLVDGLVLARSALHHSMNYRSAVVMGRARHVSDATEKLAALKAFIEHVAPGRWDHIRGPSNTEFRQTEVVAMPITEASAKVRSGPVSDDLEDHELPIWAGVLPLATVAGTPDPAVELAVGTRTPWHVEAWTSPEERLKLR